MVGAAAVQLGPPGTGVAADPRPPQVWNQETYNMAGVPWCGLVEGGASTCGEEKAPLRAFIK